MFKFVNSDLPQNANNNLRPKGIPCFKLISNETGFPIISIKKTELEINTINIPAPSISTYLWVINGFVKKIVSPLPFVKSTDLYQKNTYWAIDDITYVLADDLSSVILFSEHIFNYPSLTKTILKSFSPSRIIYKGNLLSFTETVNTLTYTDSINALQGGEEIIWEKESTINNFSYRQYKVYIFDNLFDLDIEYIEWRNNFYSQEGGDYWYNSNLGKLMLAK